MADNPNIPASSVQSGTLSPGPTAPGSSARRFRYSDTVSAVPDAVLVADSAPSIPLNWTPTWWVLAVASICFLLFYPSDIRILISRWSSDAGWSHGFVVPLICLFFVRLKWDILRRLVPQGTWVGLLVLLIGVSAQVLFRATGLLYMSPLSMLVVFFGFVLFVLGWSYLRVLWLPIAYLACAFPPPSQLYVALTTPMQRLAAEFGVQLLPLFGCIASRHGTVIDLAYGETTKQLSVEEACSGMRMLIAFFALAVALAYSTDRPVWQKLALAACALPIAIICNGMRVTLTGVLTVRVGGQWAEGNAHEYFGLLMLIPALLMQLAVAWILDRIFIEVPPSAPHGGAA